MSYHAFKDDEGNEYGSFEVFHMTAEEVGQSWDYSRIGDEGPRRGWYWWACFPGCLPDSEPCGPFETEERSHQRHAGRGITLGHRLNSEED